MINPLTPRQTQVLAFIREHLAAHGGTPTVMEICRHFGFTSPRTAAKLLEQLEQKGAISRTPGVHRSIRILDSAPIDPLRQLPLIGRIAAGAPITAGENVVELITINPALFSPRADLLFRIHGLSMINKGILPDDLVGVHRQTEVRNGQIVAAVIAHPKTDDLEFTLKTYRKKGSQISLLSENDDQETYAPMVFDTTRDSIQIVGLYAGLLRQRP